MSNSSPLPLSQKLPIGKLASLFILGVFLTVGFWYKLSKDIESHKISYQAERAAEVREVQSRIEEKFRYVYQTIRTMSFLPGVKNIDRYGKNFDSNSKLSVQQLYNNAYINIKLSEIYLLPKTIDPDKIDPNTKKGEEPILTFDEFLTTDVITEKGEEPPPEIPEVEEYEYRLMKTQMEFFAKNFPTRDSFKDLNVPVLSGPEVITCDNAEFTKKELSEHNDEPRKGLLFTVPVYGLDRKLHGGVSAVIRSQVVREMLPEKYMALVNRSHKFIATKDNTAAFSENLNNLMNANSKKSQISSGINTIEISDGSPWELVYAFDDGLFWSTPEVKDSQNLTTLLILATWTILLMLSYIVSKSHRLNLSMNRLVKDLELQSTQTESLAHTLSSSADLMNAGIQQQSSAAQETAAAMEQITSKLKQTSSNADQLVHLGEETEESALAGDGLIGTVVDSAKNLQNFANSTSEQMRELVQGLKGISNVITDIGKKTDAINEIVFQTKLLSFNASVEAARAGEAGKGFSVVAEEVGTLAQHSGTSAKEIKSSLENGIEQIENIISKNSSIIESFLSKNAELISHVIDSAEQCRESFTTINDKVQMVNQMSKEITTATFEQFRGVEESNKAISLINEMAQKNTCQNDNVIQSINELKNQSELTHSIIQRISRLMKNKNSPPPAGEDPSNSIPLAKNEFSKKYKVAS